MTATSELKARLSNLKLEYKNLKSEVDSKKIQSNGTFGKLGSPYSAIYSPDLMLGVTLSGQLHLLSLIYELSFSPDVQVVSANTDGVTVKYPKRLEEKVIRKIRENGERTGFEYDIVKYRKIAMKDVNSYFAVTESGKVKRKGLYAPAGLMKNPAAEICSDAVALFLKDGVPVEQTIRACIDVSKFVSCRAVKGGGVAFEKMVEVADWEEIEPGFWSYPGMTKKPVKRKSPPPPRSVGVGGVEFGRIARWYASKNPDGGIHYVGSGNKVPKTEGARLLMTLPDALPEDIDFSWYIDEAAGILGDIGVLSTPSAKGETE